MTDIFLVILTSIYWTFYLHRYNPTMYFYINFAFLLSPTRFHYEWHEWCLTRNRKYLLFANTSVQPRFSYFFIFCDVFLFCLSSFCVLCPMALACPFGSIWHLFIKLWYRCFIYKHVCWSCILFFNGEYTTNVDSQKDFTRPVRVGICIFLLNKR